MQNDKDITQGSQADRDNTIGHPIITAINISSEFGTGDTAVNAVKNVTLDIKPGELHVIMGRNGTGKSTLGNILTGKDGYTINKGEVLYHKKSILELSPEERSSLERLI